MTTPHSAKETTMDTAGYSHAEEVQALRADNATLRNLHLEREAETAALRREVATLRAQAENATITDAMVDTALNAWFASPPSETDQGLERSMRAALEAAQPANSGQEPWHGPAMEREMDLYMKDLESANTGQEDDWHAGYREGMRDAQKIASELGPNTGQRQEGAEPKPYCYVIPGDDTAHGDGWIDARIDCQGEFTKPLYASPQSGSEASTIENNLKDSK